MVKTRLAAAFTSKLAHKHCTFTSVFDRVQMACSDVDVMKNSIHLVNGVCFILFIKFPHAGSGPYVRATCVFLAEMQDPTKEIKSIPDNESIVSLAVDSWVNTACGQRCRISVSPRPCIVVRGLCTLGILHLSRARILYVNCCGTVCGVLPYHVLLKPFAGQLCKHFHCFH